MEELRKDDGTLYARYVYDSWGNTLHIYNASGVEITDTANLSLQNPFRYRGYYYDSESGLYYVSNRYYDSVVGRFVSPDVTDVLTATTMSWTDKNLYAYCDNNPIIRIDIQGLFWDTAIDVVSLCISATEVLANPSDPWAWAGLVGDTLDLIPFVTGVGEITKVAKITVKSVDDTGDVIKATRSLSKSKGIKRFTGSYEIKFKSGKNYVGKGGLYRSTVSASVKAKKNKDVVTSIAWSPASNVNNAFISEYNLMKKRGINNDNTYNKIWSPGRRIVQTIWSKLFGR